MSNTDTSTHQACKDVAVRHGGWNGKSTKVNLSSMNEHNLSLTLSWKQPQISVVRSTVMSNKPASFTVYSGSFANDSTPHWRKIRYCLQSTFRAQLHPDYKQQQCCNRREPEPSMPDWPLEREDPPLSCCKNSSSSV